MAAMRAPPLFRQSIVVRLSCCSFFPAFFVQKAPWLPSRKPGGFDALGVPVQELTRLLAGILDSGLSGRQNYRAFRSVLTQLLFYNLIPCSADQIH